MRHFSTKRTALWGGAALACAAALTLAFRSPEARASSDAQPLPVAAIALERASQISVERHYTGQVEARQSSELSFERSGRLLGVEVEEGDAVEAGQLLAVVDTRLLRAQQRSLKAEIASARAGLDEMLAGPRPEVIEAARAQVRELKAQLELAEAQRRRQQLLLSEERLGQQAFDEASAGVDASRARLEAGQHRLAELENGERAERIAAQRALLARLDAQLSSLAIQLDQSRLRAPFAGTVAARHLDAGTVVAPGQAVLRLVEAGQLQVRIGLPAAAVANLGSHAALEVRVAGQRYPAQLLSLLPELDHQTRTRTILLQLETLGSTPAIGELAELTLVEERAADGFWLPLSALIRGRRGLWACYALLPQGGAPASDGAVPSLFRLERRALDVLHTDGERAFVSGALEPGELVASEGLQRLSAGMNVQLSR